MTSFVTIKKIFRALRSTLVTCGLLTATLASATGHMEVSLARSTDPRTTSNATVVLTISNVGDEPVAIYKWATPFVDTDGRLPNSVFNVADEKGKPARYIGRRVYSGSVRLSQFIHVSPGETLRREIDLSREYDLSNPGWYDVSFDLHLEAMPDLVLAPEEDLSRFKPNAQSIVTTNHVALLVRDPLPAARAPSPAEELTTNCEDGSFLDIIMAEKSAQVAASSGVRFFNSTLYVRDPSGNLTFKPHPMYTRWFGEHDPDEPMRDEPGWGEGDNALAWRMIQAAEGRLIQRINPTCGCGAGYDDTFAWVEDHTPYNIHFCQKFFDAPLDGWDSRQSTMYHEMTHFWTKQIDGTSDYLIIPTIGAAENLAKSRRHDAVRSAANFEYFISELADDSRGAEPAAKE